MKPQVKKLFLLPVLMAGLGLILATRVAAQTFSFGPQVQSTNTASIIYDSGTGTFQYTDAANVSDDFADLHLTGNAATHITTSNGWTASLTANLSQRSMTATSSKDPYVGMGLIVVFNSSSENTVEIGLQQSNDTGVTNYNLYGTAAIFAAKISGQHVQTTPLGGSRLNPDGTSFQPLSGGIHASPATELINAGSGLLTFTFNASSHTLTGYYNGVPVGGISLAGWGSNPSLTLAVVGYSGQGISVAAGTDTASNFSAGLLPVITPLAPIPSGAKLILTWPISAAGFTLQSTTNLASPIWTTSSGVPVIVNGQYTVTNPISGSHQFFRLSQ
jgi:hypothetical protein